jgi:anti-sigma regulatory factor (Ser/Thr protein kinase)
LKIGHIGQVYTVAESIAGEMHVRLTSGLEAPAVARRFVAEHSGALPVALADDAELLVSELVSNAVRHGRPAITLRINMDPPLIGVSVHDEGAAMPHEADEPVDPAADGGRGLLIVDRLSSDWGVTPDDPPPGKTVWFRLDVPADA